METGSAFEVNITPALQGDLIAATGSADIQGGTVTVNGVAGVYAHGSRWTILSAAGGRTGTFDSLVEDLPFVDLSLAYDGNNAFLDAARNDTAFCLSGFTFNQCATANAVDSLGAANALAGLVAALPDAETAAQAFDLLSGEVHASAAGVLTGSSHFVRDAAVNRVRSAFDEVAAAPLPMLAYAGEGAAQALPDPERLAFWAQGLGSSGHFDGDGNAARADRSIGGVFVGGDGFVNDSIRIGLLTGYSHSSFDVDDRLSSGSADSYHIGLYGGGQWGAFGARFGGVYSSHTVEVSRIAAFPGFSEQLSADDDGSTGQLFGELGYRVTVGEAKLEPFANLAYVSTSLDDFSETGGLAALNGNSDLDTTFMTLGLRGETDVIVGETETRLFGGIGWRHAFGDVTPIAALNFAGGDPFAISGAPIAENSLALTGGFEVTLTPTARLGLTYDGQIGSNAVDHGLTADFRLKF
ncbi:MAG: autotransporter domain-containing protein [Caulobacter sp.]